MEKNSDAFISVVDEAARGGVVVLQDPRYPLSSGRVSSAKYTNLPILLVVSTLT